MAVRVTLREEVETVLNDAELLLVVIRVKVDIEVAELLLVAEILELVTFLELVVISKVVVERL